MPKNENSKEQGGVTRASDPEPLQEKFPYEGTPPPTVALIFNKIILAQRS